MQRTATLGRYRLTVSDTRRPSILGIERSVRTRSNGSGRDWISLSADSPSGASVT